MSVDLSPDIWNEIQRQVASGVFATPEEVLREALAALRSREGQPYPNGVSQMAHDAERTCVTPSAEPIV